MAKLDELILGYRKGQVATDDVCKLINTVLKSEICSSVSPDGEFTLRRQDGEKFTRCAKGRLRFQLGDVRGIHGFLLKNLRRYGFLIALLLISLICIFSSSLVWDVRISGNEILSDRKVEAALREVGFSVGTRWRGIDKNAIEAQLLSDNPDVAWISINRRGTVAYVQIIESENIGMRGDVGYPYSNIVAERDGVIEEITVDSGVAAVKVGDVVRKGQILISGVVEGECGVSMCRAAGTVRAQSVVDISANVSECAVEKTVGKTRLAEARVVLFNFSINIFKNYGNRQNSCDIIEETRKFSLFDKYKLPIRVEKVYVREYSEQERIRTADEMTELAARELDGKIYSAFKNADIIKLRTSGEFLSGEYRITSRVVYSADIGKESKIEIT